MRHKAVVIILGLLASPRLSAQATSPSFRLDNLTVNAGGAAVISPSFQLSFSVGQESVAYASSSTSFKAQTGFWGFSGVGRVPIILFLKKNTTNASYLDLAWSGDETPYILFRQIGCSSVFTRFLTSQNPQSYIDTTVPTAALVCYNTISTTSGALTNVSPREKAASPSPADLPVH